MQMYMDQFALVEYYKTRLDSLERDFSQALDKIDSLKVAHAEHHALAWQVHRREAEVAEMQQALSDAQTQVFDERKMLLKAIAENDDLKIQELKDRKKIRYLLSMTGNMEPEVTYFRDRLNKRLVKIASQDRIDKPLENRLSSTDRDIIILEDEIEGLKLKISSLYTQLDEQKQSYEETIAGLERDRKTLLEEENIRRKHEAKKMEEMLDKSDNLRQLNRENVRELLHLKKTLHQNERRLVEDKTRLTNEILELKSQYKNEKERVEHVEQQVEAKLVQKHVDLTTGLRHQLQKSTEELVAVKKKLTLWDTLKNSYNSLRRRRDYEIEGFTNDILMLRKQLKNLEKSILKYGPLEDRELVLLNMARETGNRAAQISSDLQGLKNKILSTENDLRSLLRYFINAIMFNRPVFKLPTAESVLEDKLRSNPYYPFSVVRRKELEFSAQYTALYFAIAGLLVSIVMLIAWITGNLPSNAFFILPMITAVVSITAIWNYKDTRYYTLYPKQKEYSFAHNKNVHVRGQYYNIYIRMRCSKPYYHLVLNGYEIDSRRISGSTTNSDVSAC
ncbi:hypothetical protein CcCBS67573_g06820 [Chytriomyces confervae]|uniref:Uncharacterized protein n=1 Tax=Chytriomyces confervae TaxID=246404 RepID=A0A507F1I3_9FUNG|nr:hypothetical protein CcCBS67573_g06820 [Chytriomyces confervae]